MEIGDWISWVCPSWVDNQERVEIMLRKDPWGTFFLPCCRTQPTRNSKIPASPKSLQLISVTLLLSFRCEGHQKWLEAHYNCNHDFDNNGYKAVLRSNESATKLNLLLCVIMIWKWIWQIRDLYNFFAKQLGVTFVYYYGLYGCLSSCTLLIQYICTVYW